MRAESQEPGAEGQEGTLTPGLSQQLRTIVPNQDGAMNGCTVDGDSGDTPGNRGRLHERVTAQVPPAAL
jgi:hypothetical protein